MIGATAIVGIGVVSLVSGVGADITPQSLYDEVRPIANERGHVLQTASDESVREDQRKLGPETEIVEEGSSDERLPQVVDRMQIVEEGWNGERLPQVVDRMQIVEEGFSDERLPQVVDRMQIVEEGWNGERLLPVVDRMQIIEDESGGERQPQSAHRMQIVRGLEKEGLQKQQPLTGLFNTTVDAIYVDGRFKIRFSLKNISGEELEVVHGSGQRYDLWVLDEVGEEVFRWSDDKAFTMALIEYELEKGEEIAFEEEWNREDREGSLVPAGRYKIMVEVIVGLQAHERISREELIAETLIEITD